MAKPKVANEGRWRGLRRFINGWEVEVVVCGRLTYFQMTSAGQESYRSEIISSEAAAKAEAVRMARQIDSRLPVLASTIAGRKR